jgi:hypothetical protein
MPIETSAIHLLSVLVAFVLLGLIVLILFLEFRDLILSRRIKATVRRILETPSTDGDGHETVDRYPEIEFVDPSGKVVTHKLVLTNVTWRKPGDQVTVYYRPMENDAGYKICSPFVWPKMLLIGFLSAAVLLLLFATGE